MSSITYHRYSAGSDMGLQTSMKRIFVASAKSDEHPLSIQTAPTLRIKRIH